MARQKNIGKGEKRGFPPKNLFLFPSEKKGRKIGKAREEKLFKDEHEGLLDEEGEDKGRDGGERKGKKVLKCRVERREGKGRRRRICLQQRHARFPRFTRIRK